MKTRPSATPRPVKVEPSAQRSAGSHSGSSSNLLAVRQVRTKRRAGGPARTAPSMGRCVPRPHPGAAPALVPPRDAMARRLQKLTQKRDRCLDFLVASRRDGAVLTHNYT